MVRHPGKDHHERTSRIGLSIKTMQTSEKRLQIARKEPIALPRGKSMRPRGYDREKKQHEKTDSVSHSVGSDSVWTNGDGGKERRERA